MVLFLLKLNNKDIIKSKQEMKQIEILKIIMLFCYQVLNQVLNQIFFKDKYEAKKFLLVTCRLFVLNPLF